MSGNELPKGTRVFERVSNSKFSARSGSGSTNSTGRDASSRHNSAKQAVTDRKPGNTKLVKHPWPPSQAKSKKLPVEDEVFAPENNYDALKKQVVVKPMSNADQEELKQAAKNPGAYINRSELPKPAFGPSQVADTVDSLKQLASFGGQRSQVATDPVISAPLQQSIMGGIQALANLVTGQSPRQEAPKITGALPTEGIDDVPTEVEQQQDVEQLFEQPVEKIETPPNVTLVFTSKENAEKFCGSAGWDADKFFGCLVTENDELKGSTEELVSNDCRVWCHEPVQEGIQKVLNALSVSASYEGKIGTLGDQVDMLKVGGKKAADAHKLVQSVIPDRKAMLSIARHIFEFPTTTGVSHVTPSDPLIKKLYEFGPHSSWNVLGRFEAGGQVDAGRTALGALMSLV